MERGILGERNSKVDAALETCSVTTRITTIHW